ncbi:hypothetical protein ACJRO0_04870 [Acetobacter oryzifermentans]|uniref:hypothetical protein n=1 Tax=Acetobacter oryzifermentans TaxID=1633874 RepID=UPI0039BF865B
MTDQKPTGVFIRLPLSDEQHDTLYHTIRSSGDEVALIAIGTQVACSELEVFDICDAAYGASNEKYVRQSDHQAALAQRDAEIARLRGIINTLSSKIAECGAEGYDLSGADCVDLLNDAGLIEWGNFDPEVNEAWIFDGCEPGDPIWTLKGPDA